MFLMLPLTFPIICMLIGIYWYSARNAKKRKIVVTPRSIAKYQDFLASLPTLDLLKAELAKLDADYLARNVNIDVYQASRPCLLDAIATKKSELPSNLATPTTASTA